MTVAKDGMAALLPGERVRVPMGVKTDRFCAGMEGSVVENRPELRNCLVTFEQETLQVGYRFLERAPPGNSGPNHPSRPSSRRGLEPLEPAPPTFAKSETRAKPPTSARSRARSDAKPSDEVGRLQGLLAKRAEELRVCKEQLQSREAQLSDILTAFSSAQAATARFNGLLQSVAPSLGVPAAVYEPAMTPVQAPSSPQPSLIDSLQSQMSPACLDSASVENNSQSSPPSRKIQRSTTQAKLDRQWEKAGIDSSLCINSAVWVKAIERLQLDPDEGQNIFKRIEDNAAGRADLNTNDGYPIREFLDELNVDLFDREGVESIMKIVVAAKAELSKQSLPKDKSATKTMFNKVVRHLHPNDLGADAAWDLVSDGKVPMSKVERAEFEAWKDRKQEFTERVHTYMVEPPVVNATAGQTLCRELCIAEIDEIVARCQSEGTKFTDPEWDLKANASSALYVDKEGPGHDCTVAPPAKVMRLSTIVKNSGGNSANKAMNSLFGGFSSGPKPVAKPVLFKGGVQPGDIVQGAIGTCFFLGALGAIGAHNESMIENMFIRYDVDVGVYGLRFMLDGEWTYVIVDDWMPVDFNGRLLYACCKDPTEVWVPLLEKAFCKLHTCYEMCDGGHASEAIAAMFGGCGGRFKVKGVHKRSPEKYFAELKEAREKGWLLTTSFKDDGDGEAELLGKCGEQVLASGLTAGHAYSVLRLVEAQGNLLVCCQNPWGEGEWTGTWSDENASGEWTEEMRVAVGFTNANDGIFWMSIEDFVAHTTGVEFARTFGPNWNRATQYTRFQRRRILATATKAHVAARPCHLTFSEGDQIEVKTFASNWWSGCLSGSDVEGDFPKEYVEMCERPVTHFHMVGTCDSNATGPMTVVVMLMQPNIKRQRRFYKREQDGKRYKDLSYTNMKLCIIAPDGSVAAEKEGQERCLWMELKLPGGGLWRIYALSPDGLGGIFSLRVYAKDGSLSLKEIPGATFSEMLDVMAA